MEEVVTRAFAGGKQVFVAFSGGRDSSAVLAVAATVARREGFPPPIALTYVWPAISSVDESTWQQIVLQKYPEVTQACISVTDEFDLLGSAARTHLERRGLIWPFTAHSADSLHSSAADGVLLDGEGGDELFGPTRLRILKNIRRFRPHPDLAPMLGAALLPAQLRRHANQCTVGRPWLRGATGKRITAALARELDETPLSAAREIASVPQRRGGRMARANIAAEARRHGVLRMSPLLDPLVVGAVAQRAGFLGWANRTEAMKDVFADVVPDAVLSRTDKPNFSDALWGPSTMKWLSQWDRRSGVDPSTVSISALVEQWSRRTPHVGTAMLAQAAWMTQELGVQPGLAS